MPDFLTTKELAELLRVKQRKVYDLVATGKVPFSKATGKLLFPKEAIERWIADGSGIPAVALKSPPNVFLGSHDPLLDWALRESQCGIATYFDGSLDGVERFVRREGIATGLHIYDGATTRWNLHVAEARCADMAAVMCHWSTRMRGLIVAEKIAHSIGSLKDVAGLSFVPRQPQAGAHALFLHLLNAAGLDEQQIDITAAVRTETDSALTVSEGGADFAFGLEAVAAQYRLPFLPLIEERFDLLVDRRAWFESGFQKLLTFTRSDAFARHARGLRGYDVSESGTILFNGV